MDSKTARKILYTLSGVYGAGMVVLLFGRSRLDVGTDYWQQVQMNVNLTPFYSISQYLYLLTERPNPHLLGYAFVNLFGNIAAFVPLGFLLPCLWQKGRRFGWFLLGTAALLVAVELTQLFTLLGSCDVDDVILNLFGALIGYGVFWMNQKRKKA